VSLGYNAHLKIKLRREDNLKRQEILTLNIKQWMLSAQNLLCEHILKKHLNLISHICHGKQKVHKQVLSEKSGE